MRLKMETIQTDFIPRLGNTMICAAILRGPKATNV